MGAAAVAPGAPPFSTRSSASRSTWSGKSSTQMTIVVQEDSNLPLLVDSMTITHVSVDEESAESKFLPRHQLVEDEQKFSSVLSSKSAADVACSIYYSSLDKEMSLHLLIACNISKKTKPATMLREQKKYSRGLH